MFRAVAVTSICISANLIIGVQMKNKNKLASNAGYVSRFLLLVEAFFSGKGFFTKVGMLVIILGLFIPNLAVSVVFFVLIFIFVAVVALMKEKDVNKITKQSSKGVVAFGKYAISGDIGSSLAKSIGDTVVSAIGEKLAIELRLQKLTLSEIGSLTKYFKLLKVKDKTALKFVQANGAKKTLTAYNQAHGSTMKLEGKIQKEKKDKAALKKAARKATKNTPVYGPVVPPVVVP